jgi:type IV pilus assembly protein PilN
MLINLLPHRQWALTRKRKAFAMSIGLAALVGALMAVGTSAWLGRQLAAQRAANSSLQQAIAAVEGQLKLKAQVKADLGELSLRETTLQDLRDESQLTGVLLKELAVHLPDGLYVTAMKQEGDKVRINGVARSGDEVFELLRQMVSDGQWLARPELIEVAAAPAAPLQQGAPVGTPFSMRAWLKRPDLPADGGPQLHSSALD